MGSEYEIDRVRIIRTAAAERASGGGDRYINIVKRTEKYLFFERSTELAGNHSEDGLSNARLASSAR
jgi:hypothetical protein